MLSGISIALKLKKEAKGTGEGGEVTLEDNIQRIIVPEALSAYLVSLGEGWRKAFLKRLASMTEIIEGHVRRIIVLENSTLNEEVNLSEQGTLWLNWTPELPVYPGANQLNHP